MRGRGLSQRRSLNAIGMSASAFRYAPRPDRNVELRAQIIALAQRHRRFGVGMIYLKLRHQGQIVNYKRVERLYGVEKLQVRRRRRKKLMVTERHPLSYPAAANAVWSMDFVFNRIATGRTLKCLAIVDDATHEAVAVTPEHSMKRSASDAGA
jgi:putative transposase